MVNIGNVWDRTAEFLSDNLQALLPVTLLAIFLPTSIITSLRQLLLTAPSGARIALSIAIVLIALVMGWGRLMLTAIALETPADGHHGALAWRRLPAMVAVGAVLVIVAVVSILPVGIVLQLGGVDLVAMQRGETPELSSGYGAILGVYFLVWAVAGLWLLAKLALVLPVIVAEGRWFGAIARSWALTRGIALKIVGVILLYVIVSWVAQLAANLVFGSVFRLVAGGGDGGVSLASVLTTIVVGVVQSIFVVMASVFAAKLYQALNPVPSGLSL